MKKITAFAVFFFFIAVGFAQQLKKGEYYFDTDPGVGNGTAYTFTQADSINIPLNISTGTLTVGFHRIYTRIMGTNNKWGFSSDNLFYIYPTTPPVAPATATQLKKGEYYLDTDPGVGNGTSFTFTPADSINIPLNVSTGTLAVGFHKVYTRVMSVDNKWGLSDEKLFYVYSNSAPVAPPVSAPVAAMEYFFDALDYGPGQGAYLNPFTPMDSVLVNGLVIAEDPLFLTPLSVGIHTLNIRAKDLVGKWSMTKSLAFTVCDQPATAAYTQSVSGTTVAFTNNSTNSFGTQWIFGDGTTSSLINPTHTYNNGGTLNVGLISYSGCGNDTVWNIITLNCVSPTTAFTSSVTNLSAAFSNSSNGASTYSWNFGDTKTSILANPTHIYQNAGTYTVCLTTTNGCGSATSCNTIAVTCVAPVAGYSVDINGFTASITNTSTNAFNFLWNFGDATTNNVDFSPVKQYTAAGTYNLKLTVSNGCGANIYQAPITIACVSPSLNFNTYTDGLGVEVENNSLNGTTWSWNFGDGITSAFKNPPVHTYTTTGTYTITLTATNSCGTQTITQVVSVCTPPIAQYSVNPNGLIINFTNTSSNAASYVWNFGDGLITNIVSPTHTFVATGNYSVCLNTTNVCGNSQYCTNINVMCNILPQPDICLVTVDSLSINNEIYWEKSLYLMADSFIVYREVSTSVFNRIGAVSNNAFSMYTDTNRSIGPNNGNPNLTSYKYRLQIRDTCGTYSALSLWHQTLFIQDQQNGNFNWNSYAIESSGTPVSNYNLKRRDLITGIETLVGSTSSNLFTDPAYSTFWPTNTKWFVDAVGFNCNPTARVANPNGTLAQKVKTKSNHANDRTFPTKLNDINSIINLKAYPNPAKDILTVEIGLANENMSIELNNVLGQTLTKMNTTENINKINTSNYVSGLYFLNIKLNNKTVAVKKIVIE